MSGVWGARGSAWHSGLAPEAAEAGGGTARGQRAASTRSSFCPGRKMIGGPSWAGPPQWWAGPSGGCTGEAR